MAHALGHQGDGLAELRPCCLAIRPPPERAEQRALEVERRRIGIGRREGIAVRARVEEVLQDFCEVRRDSARAGAPSISSGARLRVTSDGSSVGSGLRGDFRGELEPSSVRAGPGEGVRVRQAPPPRPVGADALPRFDVPERAADGPPLGMTRAERDAAGKRRERHERSDRRRSGSPRASALQGQDASACESRALRARAGTRSEETKSRLASLEIRLSHLPVFLPSKSRLRACLTRRSD